MRSMLLAGKTRSFDDPRFVSATMKLTLDEKHQLRLAASRAGFASESEFLRSLFEQHTARQGCPGQYVHNNPLLDAVSRLHRTTLECLQDRMIDALEEKQLVRESVEVANEILNKRTA